VKVSRNKEKTKNREEEREVISLREVFIRKITFFAIRKKG